MLLQRPVCEEVGRVCLRWLGVLLLLLLLMMLMLLLVVMKAVCGRSLSSLVSTSRAHLQGKRPTRAVGHIRGVWISGVAVIEVEI